MFVGFSIFSIHHFKTRILTLKPSIYNPKNSPIKFTGRIYCFFRKRTAYLSTRSTSVGYEHTIQSNGFMDIYKNYISHMSYDQERCLGVS